MAGIKRGRSNRLVLDIGTSAIRLCELSQTKAGFQLTKYFQRELNIDPAMDEEEKSLRRHEVLDALLKEAKIRTKNTVMAVPGQSVFTRNRPLPPVPEYKVTQIVKYEIQQQIPFSLDQISLDYQVLSRTEAGGYDVMMAAIKVDVVEKQLEILEKVKRRITVVDVAPLAAYNWLHHTGEFGEEGQVVALVDMGASTTDIVIQKDNHFCFTRSLNIGGNDVTKAIAEGFNLSFEDAERLKRERGFAPTGNVERDGKGGEVIGKVLSRLVSEINRSFAYFRSQPGGGPTSRVILTGGGTCLRNMIPYLQKHLGIEVRIAQPLAGLAVGPGAQEASEHPEQTCVVLGLALRGSAQVPIEINLIPPRVLETARRREQALYWVLSLATLFLIVASSIPVTAAKDDLVRKRIKQLETVLASYDPALVSSASTRSKFESELKSARANIEAYEEDVAMLDGLRNNRMFWLKYLKVINDARPESGAVALNSIESTIIGGLNNTGEPFRTGNTTARRLKSGRNRRGSYWTSNFPSLEGPSKASIAPPTQGGVGITRKKGNYGRSIPEPNGLILNGYAESIEVLELFIDRLTESDAFVEDGIYFHVRLADNVPDSELDRAQTTGTSEGKGGVARRGSANLSNEWETKVTKFRIDLQFLGRPISQPG